MAESRKRNHTYKRSRILLLLWLRSRDQTTRGIQGGVDMSMYDGIEKPREVTFKYYLPDNDYWYWLNVNADKFHRALEEINLICRSHCKNGDDDELIELAQSIRDLIPNLEFDLNG